MKTQIKVTVTTQDNRTIQCRVKLDANKFPYIIIDNEKVILNSSDFPRDITYCYGLYTIKVDIISGKEELDTILANPELTCDKLGLKQIMRTG